MEIALLGGSFNPPHVGHLLAAVYVRATCSVDEVWLMPAARHPFGKPLAAFEHRVNMCEQMALDASGWLKVSIIERDIPGEGRTVDTIQVLLERFPEHHFSLVIGSDILADLPCWKDFDRIRQMAKVIVLNRSGYPVTEAIGPALAEVSSTQVREQLERGETPTTLVPGRVLTYVKMHGLYKS